MRDTEVGQAAPGRALVAVVVAVVGVTVGSAVAGGWWLGSHRTDDRSDPVIALAKDWPGIPYARIRGNVMLTHGCVTVGGDLAVWPRGAKLASRDGTKGIALAGGTFVRLGSALHSAGGSYDVAFSGLVQMIGADQAEAVRTCAARLHQTSFVVVFPER